MNRTVLKAKVLTAKNYGYMGLAMLALMLLMARVDAAQADLVVIVNKASSVNEVSNTELSRLYLGKTSMVSNGTKLIPVDQSENSDTKTEFYQLLTNKTPLQVNAYWSRMIFTGQGRPPESYRTVEEIVSRVSQDPRLIAYVDAAQVVDGVKVVGKLP